MARLARIRQMSGQVSREELFDYCQILEAYISKKGWAFLIDYYGYEKLYEIDKKSGWFDDETLEKYIASVQYEIDISEE